MKKGLLVVSIAAVVLAVLGLAGYAVAQGRTMLVNNVSIPSGPGMMNGRNGIGPGMMNGQRGTVRGFGMMGTDLDEAGPMHSYMIAAVAKALDTTPEELQNQMNSGVTPWQIAQKNGMTAEQFQTAMTTATAEALKQAVTDGVITQAQADLMSQHMQGWGFGFGPGNGGFPRMGPGGRRNNNRP